MQAVSSRFKELISRCVGRLYFEGTCLYRNPINPTSPKPETRNLISSFDVEPSSIQKSTLPDFTSKV